MSRPDQRTPLSASVLQQFLDTSGWSQYDLADRAGVHRSTVSMQLAAPYRPIREEHLARYLRALDPTQRKTLLAAWLRDVLGNAVVDEFIDPATNRVREEILAWAPTIDETDKKMLEWLSSRLISDPELAEVVRGLCRRLGFEPS